MARKQGKRGYSTGFKSWWYKRGGGKRRCDISGVEYYINEHKLYKQRGLNVDRQNFDSLTDKQRQDLIKQI